MTLEERIKHLLAESEKEDIVAEEEHLEVETDVSDLAEEQIYEFSSGVAKHNLADNEKRSHGGFMKTRFGVDTVFHKRNGVSYGVSYHGPEERVKKAILHHYDGKVRTAKKHHPELFESYTEDQLDELSKSTLSSYANAASADAAAKSAVSREMRAGAKKHERLADLARNRAASSFHKDQADEYEDAAHNAEEIKRKRVAGVGKAVDKMRKESEDHSTVSDQVSALLEAEGLSEDFKLQAVTIFEAAVSDRVMQIEEELKQEYQEALEEATAEMETNIDGFMSEAIQQWMIDNKLAVETNFKHKLQESFMDGLTALLAEHNIELPAESENALDVALDQITTLEESVEAASAREAELLGQISEMKAAAIMESYRSKMPATTFDRFSQLTGNIAFKTEEQFIRQLDIVYENFGKVSTVVESAPARRISESIAQPAITEDLHESVEFYANYMSK